MAAVRMPMLPVSGISAANFFQEEPDTGREEENDAR
jgi:hypothetical protein